MSLIYPNQQHERMRRNRSMIMKSKRAIHTETELWFGIHKGKLMKDCPRSYIILVRDNTDIPLTTSVIILSYEKEGAVN